MGASAFLKSVYFRAFAVNVKTIALKKYLYQFGHAIWCGRSVDKIIIYLLPDFMAIENPRNFDGSLYNRCRNGGICDVKEEKPPTRALL